MSDNARQVVQRLWGYCNVLRDDGLSYPDYVEQLTYLLFLKMADEQRDVRTKLSMPVELSWAALIDRRGLDLRQRYGEVLGELGRFPGMLGTIFANASNKIRDPQKLQLLVDMIGNQTWSSAQFDVKGSIYEGLLEKNAQDTKSGAGQYFTPRPLVDAIVECVNPGPDEVVFDPACGTGGFLISTANYLRRQTPSMSISQEEHLRLVGIRGMELVPEVTRLAAMNLFLHGIGPDSSEGEVPVQTGDSLASVPASRYDVVLTNPPFGKKSSFRISTVASSSNTSPETFRPDLWYSTSHKELNFLQHVASALKPGGRAAMVIPDGALAGGGVGSAIRRRLLEDLDVHTLLRLPPGIFYAQGVNANVLFFDGLKPSPDAKLWVYDLRSETRFTMMGRRFGRHDIEDFVSKYGAGDRSRRAETWSSTNPRGRWRSYRIGDILATNDTALDISWIARGPQSSGRDASTLMREIVDDLQAALQLANELMGDEVDREEDIEV